MLRGEGKERDRTGQRGGYTLHHRSRPASVTIGCPILTWIPSSGIVVVKKKELLCVS